MATTVLWDHREEFSSTSSTSSVEDSSAEAALKLTSRVDVDHVCDAVLNGVERVFAPRLTWIALHDEAADMLQVRFCRGPGAEVLRDAGYRLVYEVRDKVLVVVVVAVGKPERNMVYKAAAKRG